MNSLEKIKAIDALTSEQQEQLAALFEEERAKGRALGKRKALIVVKTTILGLSTAIGAGSSITISTYALATTPIGSTADAFVATVIMFFLYSFTMGVLFAINSSIPDYEKA